MSKHDEFPTKPNYQAIAESLEKENEILRSMNETQKKMVEIQTQRLNELTQGVKDAIGLVSVQEMYFKSEIENTSGTEKIIVEYTHCEVKHILDILTKKTGISA